MKPVQLEWEYDWPGSLSARRAWIETVIIHDEGGFLVVALRKEGVD